MLQRSPAGCVIIGEKDQINGIITERDILKKVVGKHLDLNIETVSECMTKNPNILLEHDPIAYALNLMVDGGFRHVPVTNDLNQAVGVISMQNIVGHLGEYFHDEVINIPPNPLRIQQTREGG